MRYLIASFILVFSIFIVMMISFNGKDNKQVIKNEPISKEQYFMTKIEYGKLLYENPRGISCKKCHGVKGKGKLISSFKHIHNEEKVSCEVRAPDISNMSFEEFKKIFDPNYKINRKKFKQDICKYLTYGRIMPKYFLSDDELKAIHAYLSKKNIN